MPPQAEGLPFQSAMSDGNAQASSTNHAQAVQPSHRDGRQREGHGGSFRQNRAVSCNCVGILRYPGSDGEASAQQRNPVE